MGQGTFLNFAEMRGGGEVRGGGYLGGGGDDCFYVGRGRRKRGCSLTDFWKEREGKEEMQLPRRKKGKKSVFLVREKGKGMS